MIQSVKESLAQRKQMEDLRAMREADKSRLPRKECRDEWRPDARFWLTGKRHSNLDRLF
jgi:hypothetical protein